MYSSSVSTDFAKGVNPYQPTELKAEPNRELEEHFLSLFKDYEQMDAMCAASPPLHCFIENAQNRLIDFTVLHPAFKARLPEKICKMPVDMKTSTLAKKRFCIML